MLIGFHCVALLLWSWLLFSCFLSYLVFAPTESDCNDLKNSLTNHISTLKYIIKIFTIEKMSSWTILCELLHRKKRSYFLLKSLLPVKGDRELCKIMCNKNSLSILYCLTEQKHHLPAFCKRSIIVLDGLQNNTTFQDFSLIYRPLNWEDKQFFISQKN